MHSDYIAKHSLHKIGVGGLCLYQDRILFVKHKYGVSEGLWTLPGGYVELGESLTSAIEREVLEETGVKTQALELLAIRHMTNEKEGKGLISDLYIVFRLEYLGGKPLAGDLLEVTDAQFLQVANLDTHSISDLSKHIVQQKTKKSGFNLLPYQPSSEIKDELNVYTYQLFG
ncbi:MAG: NUDIX domain-containing protein [Candidatus Heimdallarchaeota archaeon]|nr:NUDIX domain-containing protein [Candidatus Heimdallarchaeota archaeon]MCK4876674.1 NUDIX domain-containing protein [Candidatus Heimdallarchaeota archaeon]